MTPDSTVTARPERLLERFPRFASADLDEVRSQVGRVFCEHELRVVGTGSIRVCTFAVAATSAWGACIMAPAWTSIPVR
jgi:hypothetical protein